MKRHKTPFPSRIIFAVLFVLAMNAAAFAAGDTWSLAASVHTPRDGHTATLLPNGNVVIAGGENNNQALASTEVYSSLTLTGKWTATGNLNTSRLEHTATLLMNGNVLIAGGNFVTANQTIVLSSAEIYKPVTGVWSKTGSMSSFRVGHTVTLLTSAKSWLRLEVTRTTIW